MSQSISERVNLPITSPISNAASNVALYEQDYCLWIADVLKKLQNGDFTAVDWVNLIEEIEDLGRSQKRELESRLGELLEHILKRTYVNLPECYRGWVISIDKQRIALQGLLEDSPSLRNHLIATFDKVYFDILKILRRAYPDCEFPQVWLFSRDVDDLLNEDFWL